MQTIHRIGVLSLAKVLTALYKELAPARRDTEPELTAEALKALRMSIGKVIARTCGGRQVDAHRLRMASAREKRN